jgi:large subunit ribosomal protein L20
MRSTSGPVTKRRHKKIIKLAKGYRGLRKNVFGTAKNAVMKAGTNAYRDRRRKKREFRNLWNARINAACRSAGTNYSRFIDALFKNKVVLNRKMLSEIAIHHPDVFNKIVEEVK